ncbi:MAG: sel1 repeat family protein [Muribaculaceae bacterium]
MNKKTLISLVVIVAVISTASAIFYSCRRDPSKPAYTEDLLRRAQEGDVNAEFFIGRSYYDGNGVERDYRKAVEYFRSTAAKGSVRGQCGLGWCYFYGQGVPVDYRKAVKWLTLASNAGHPLARYLLGVCYLKGHGVAKDEIEGLHLLDEAISLGAVEAITEKGIYYRRCNKLEKGLELIRKASDKGDPRAQFIIGLYHYRGTAVQQDFELAVDYFKEAANGGFVAAQRALGTCYFYGDGVAQDYEKAVKWWMCASKQGDSESQYNLAFCYMKGRGVYQDDNEAFRLFTLSASSPNEYALSAHQLAECYHHGIGTERNDSLSDMWRQRAAQLGYIGR